MSMEICKLELHKALRLTRARVSRDRHFFLPWLGYYSAFRLVAAPIFDAIQYPILEKL